MPILRLVQAPFRYKLWRPSHVRLVANDAVSLGVPPEQDHVRHLRAAIEWLCLAQDVRADKTDAGGVSAGWSFEDGWLPSYPETSGYIVETFLAAAEVLNCPDLIARAHRIIDWELSIQYSDGAFPGHFGEPGSHPVIFNTGQIMHGMLAGYLQLGREECLDSAVRAAHWLAHHQDPDGCWRSFEHNGVPHAYNTRSTWALLTTGLLVGDRKLKVAAIRNLDWAVQQQEDSGWFASNAFVPAKDPFTHTIAYCIRGLLESAMLLGEGPYLEAAIRAAAAVAKAQREDGWLAGTYTSSWDPSAAYCCLTGVAQMSVNWTRLAQVAGLEQLRSNARKAIMFLKRTHRVENREPPLKGAIAGSFPIWGGYSRFEFPNWAAKFFADALIMDLKDTAVPPMSTTESPLAQEAARV